MRNTEFLSVTDFPTPDKKIKSEIMYPTRENNIFVFKKESHLRQSTESAIGSPKMNSDKVNVN